MLLRNNPSALRYYLYDSHANRNDYLLFDVAFVCSEGVVPFHSVVLMQASEFLSTLILENIQQVGSLLITYSYKSENYFFIKK